MDRLRLRARRNSEPAIEIFKDGECEGGFQVPISMQGLGFCINGVLTAHFRLLARDSSLGCSIVCMAAAAAVFWTGGSLWRSGTSSSGTLLNGLGLDCSILRVNQTPTATSNPLGTLDLGGWVIF